MLYFLHVSLFYHMPSNVSIDFFRPRFTEARKFEELKTFHKCIIRNFE